MLHRQASMRLVVTKILEAGKKACQTTWSVLRVLCGPLRLCVEYWVLKEQDTILSAKAQRTAKHAEVNWRGSPRRDLISAFLLWILKLL
jgi:hypothetical protein